MAIEIHGACEPAFAPLKAAFAENFEAGLEVGASLCVMRHGRAVLDLWAGHRDFARTRPWEPDTWVVLFSSSKVPLILSFLTLVGRGAVDLDAPVAAYWPAFAAGGKDRVSVRDALCHCGGVPGFAPAVAFEDLHHWDRATANIAAQTHWFGGERRVAYHPTTYGYLVGEIMRRVDGRMPSDLYRAEVGQPSGADLTMRLRTQEEEARAAEVGFLAGLPARPDIDPRSMPARVFGSIGPGDFTSWARRSAEIPAGNSYGNGRALARLGAIGAGGGELEGRRYFPQWVWDEATRTQVEGEDWLFGHMRQGLGFGLDSPGFPSPTPTTAHWGGYGGSFSLIDQPSGISAGYAQNNLIDNAGRGGAMDPRQQRLWAALGEVMRRL